MKKTILFILLFIVSGALGAIGYSFYLDNSKAWKVTTIVPIFQKSRTKEYLAEQDRLYAKLAAIKIELFQKQDWPEFKSQWLEINKRYRREGKVKQIEIESNETIEEGYKLWLTNPGWSFVKLSEIKSHIGDYPPINPIVASMRLILYHDDPQVVEIKQKIDFHWQNKDESTYFDKEVGIKYRIEGKQAGKKIICSFINKEGEKVGSVSRIYFEAPPYQEEEKKGILTNEIESIDCYIIE